MPCGAAVPNAGGRFQNAGTTVPATNWRYPATGIFTKPFKLYLNAAPYSDPVAVYVSESVLFDKLITKWVRILFALGAINSSCAIRSNCLESAASMGVPGLPPCSVDRRRSRRSSSAVLNAGSIAPLPDTTPFPSGRRYHKMGIVSFFMVYSLCTDGADCGNLMDFPLAWKSIARNLESFGHLLIASGSFLSVPYQISEHTFPVLPLPGHPQRAVQGWKQSTRSVTFPFRFEIVAPAVKFISCSGRITSFAAQGISMWKSTFRH